MSAQLTKLETITKAINMTGRELTSTVRSGATHQSILEEMYEFAQLAIARAFMFPELDERDTTTADTTEDTATYSFSTLFGATARVRDILAVIIEDGTSSVRCKRVEFRYLLQKYPYPEGEATNKPTTYTRIGNNLLFFPTPDATYDIHSVRSNFPARKDNDEYSAYEDKDDLLIVATLAEYFDHLQEKEEATYFRSVFKQKLVASVRPLLHPTDWEPEGRAFDSSVLSPGDFYNNPLVLKNI